MTETQTKIEWAEIQADMTYGGVRYLELLVNDRNTHVGLKVLDDQNLSAAEQVVNDFINRVFSYCDSHHPNDVRARWEQYRLADLLPASWDGITVDMLQDWGKPAEHDLYAPSAQVD